MSRRRCTGTLPNPPAPDVVCCLVGREAESSRKRWPGQTGVVCVSFACVRAGVGRAAGGPRGARARGARVPAVHARGLCPAHARGDGARDAAVGPHRHGAAGACCLHLVSADSGKPGLQPGRARRRHAPMFTLSSPASWQPEMSAFCLATEKQMWSAMGRCDAPARLLVCSTAQGAGH